MELEIHGAVWQVVSNPYDFTASNGDRMVGVAHHVYVLDFGDGKTPDRLGTERSIIDVRLDDAQMTALKPGKDDECHWRVSIRPNGNKFRYDLVTPVSAPKAA